MLVKLCTCHRPSLGGGGGTPNTTLYGDFLGDLNNYFTQVKVKSLRARRRTRPGHLPSTAGSCLLSCLALVHGVPSLSVSLLLHSAMPGSFGSASVSLPPPASIQGQQHSHFSRLLQQTAAELKAYSKTGTYTGVFYPGGRGNEGGLVSKSLAPRGKHKTL